MRKVLLALLFMALVNVCSARTMLRMEGIATDSVATPLAYTDILLKRCNLKIMSDAEGRFVVEVPRLKKVTFLWCNYKPVSVRLWRSKKLAVKMSLTKSEIKEIDK